jgi:MFS family permease
MVGRTIADGLRERPRSIAAGVALGAAVGYNIANLGPAADVLANEYDVRLGAIGFLTTALFATHLVMQLPGGRLVDKRGARTLGIFALAIIVFGNLLAVLVTSFAGGLVGRLVAGLGTGVGFVAGSEYVRAMVGTAGAQGLYGAAGVGGGGLALAIVPLTVPALDWRAPYVTALVCACVVLLCLPLAPRDRGRRERPRSDGASVAGILGDRRLYPLAVAHTASFGLSVIVGTWAVSLLQHDGYGRRLAGAVAALTLLGGLVTRPIGGRVLQRRPEYAAQLLGVSMVLGAIGTLVLLSNVLLPARIVGAALLGLAAGLPFAAAFTGAQWIRRDAPAAAVGFINTCATLLIVVGAPLVGFTFALPGHGRVGFVVLAVLWALACLAVRPSRLPILSPDVEWPVAANRPTGGERGA